MSLPPRFPTPDRPDLESLLLAAVAERDHGQARRLADQLVHRRGVGACQRLMAGRLTRAQGADAALWLSGVAGLEPPEPGPTAHALAVDRPEAISPPVAISPAIPQAELSLDPSWIEDLVREERALARISAEAASTSVPQELGALPSSATDLFVPIPTEASAPRVAEDWLFRLAAVTGESSPACAEAACADSAFAEAALAEAAFTEAVLAEPAVSGAGHDGFPGDRTPAAPPAVSEREARPSQAEPLIPRLMAGSQSRPARHAPAPASLARFRAWLHDDDALAEAS